MILHLHILHRGEVIAFVLFFLIPYLSEYRYRVSEFMPSHGSKHNWQSRIVYTFIVLYIRALDPCCSAFPVLRLIRGHDLKHTGRASLPILSSAQGPTSGVGPVSSAPNANNNYQPYYSNGGYYNNKTMNPNGGGGHDMGMVMQGTFTSGLSAHASQLSLYHVSSLLARPVSQREQRVSLGVVDSFHARLHDTA